jgi:glycosyltransferase involved in cell wall biosynthesis
LVLTRSIAQDSSFGREKTLREIHRALDAGFEVRQLQLHSLLETRRIRDFASAGARWLFGLVTGRPIPLQTVLYSGETEIRRLAHALSEDHFDAVYVDSVRCQILARRLRARLPNVRLVVDFDDLMSRRLEQLNRKRIPLSLGFLQHLAPKPLQSLIQGPLSGLITRYEAAALKRAELEMVNSAQAVVLVSSAERDILRRTVTSAKRATIHAIPPPATTCEEATAVSGPYRFVFIGSDRLAQNRLSIDFLLALWRRLTPDAELHIYGRQQRNTPSVRGVRWHGFVTDVSDAYTKGSVLLLPTLLPGGIKTKVIEAWSFGCPVLGNPLAFEGLEPPDYPLVQPEDRWTEYILQPDRYSHTWTSAARIGNAFVRTILSPERYGTAWRALLTADPGELKADTRAGAKQALRPREAILNDIPG